MIESTLCYLEKDGKYLMLYRNKKKNDINEGKWIGIGGKFKKKENAEEKGTGDIAAPYSDKVEKAFRDLKELYISFNSRNKKEK